MRGLHFLGSNIPCPLRGRPFPSGDRLFIPARFRVFANYDLWKSGVEGKEVQQGLQRARMYQISHGSILEGDYCFLRCAASPGPDPGASLHPVAATLWV